MRLRAYPADDPSDPLEKFNRKVYAFNTKVADRYALRPVAKAYVKLPQPVRNSIGNFFANLSYPTVFVNDLLQFKLKQGAADGGRFLLNSTAGIGGLFDVATQAGLPAHDEDFGVTLGHWGIGQGWFLMLPMLGPSDNRDGVGLVGSYFANPLHWVPSDYDGVSFGLGALNGVNERASYLDTDRMVENQLDPYIFIRTAYLQHRESLVNDGRPQKIDYSLDDPEVNKEGEKPQASGKQ